MKNKSLRKNEVFPAGNDEHAEIIRPTSVTPIQSSRGYFWFRFYFWKSSLLYYEICLHVRIISMETMLSSKSP